MLGLFIQQLLNLLHISLPLLGDDTCLSELLKVIEEIVFKFGLVLALNLLGLIVFALKELSSSKICIYDIR